MIDPMPCDLLMSCSQLLALGIAIGVLVSGLALAMLSAWFGPDRPVLPDTDT